MAVTLRWQCQEVIEYLKYTCPAHVYAISISPPAAQQIISAIKVLLGEDGSKRGKKFFLVILCSFQILTTRKPLLNSFL